MNAVGLFLEESEERDYLGLASFIALSYILVPFQAYASLKGFLEREEGPWFRTPKTGRITDIFTRGRFYRLIAGILPGKAPALASLTISHQPLAISKYLSLATANSRFNSFNIKPRSLRARWVGKVLVTLFLIISTTMLYFSPSIPSYPDEVIANGTDFRWDQTPRLILDLKEAKSFKQGILPKTNEVYAAQDEQISTKVYYQGRVVDLPTELNYTNEGKLEVSLKANDDIRPGKYRLEVTDQRDGREVSISQDFNWGVLAINTDKSIYLPGDQARLTFAVLDDNGKMVCDALIRLKIKSPQGQEAFFSTEDETIKVNPECELKGYTEVPDYEAEFQANEAGVYNMELSALTENGPRAIKDSFEVKDWVPFEIKKEAPTRIYPAATYNVRLKFKVNEDFNGEVVESVPDSFKILNPKPEIQNKFKIQSSKIQSRKEIVWDVDWKKGEAHQLEYKFDAPDESPQFYLLGPLELKITSKSQIANFDSQDEGVVFQEARRWQIASDVTIGHTLLEASSNMTNQTVYTTGSVTPAANSLIIVAVTQSSSIAHAAPTLSGNNLTYVEISGATTEFDVIATPLKRITLFRAMGASPSAGAITITFANAQSRALWSIHQFTNVDTSGTNGSGAVVQAANNRGDGVTSLIVTLGTLGAADNATFGAFSHAASADTTAGTGFAELSDINPAEAQSLQTEWQNPHNSDTTVDASWASSDAGAVAIEIVVVPEYTWLFFGLGPFLPGLISKLRKKRNG